MLKTFIEYTDLEKIGILHESEFSLIIITIDDRVWDYDTEAGLYYLREEIK